MTSNINPSYNAYIRFIYSKKIVRKCIHIHSGTGFSFGVSQKIGHQKQMSKKLFLEGNIVWHCNKKWRVAAICFLKLGFYLFRISTFNFHF